MNGDFEKNEESNDKSNVWRSVNSNKEQPKTYGYFWFRRKLHRVAKENGVA